MSQASIATQPRMVDQLIGQYAESHRHPRNVLIHWICVPIIVWCVIAFAWLIHPWVAYVGGALGLAYYLTLSLPMAAAMAMFFGVALAITPWVPHVGWVAAALFVITWAFQFVGHEIEGKKPSFFDDLRFLLVGPVFLLSKAFRKLGVPY
jgi:uncharacterized membrane protein YGL010W